MVGCLPEVAEPSDCPAGSTEIDGECVRDDAPAPVACPAGSVSINGGPCLPLLDLTTLIDCPADQVLIGGSCVELLIRPDLELDLDGIVGPGTGSPLETN